MTLSPKQCAKRRWKDERDHKAKVSRELRQEDRSTTVRLKTKFGILNMRGHPLFMGGTRLPAPGFYDLTR